MEASHHKTENISPNLIKSKIQEKRPDSPESSCVSMKNDQSIRQPSEFKDGNPTSGHSQIQAQRSDSPVPSCLSLKSEKSILQPPEFKDGDPTSGHSQIQAQRSDSPVPSCFSLKSEKSILQPPEFKAGDPTSGHSQTQGIRPDSHLTSYECIKSESSTNAPLQFTDGGSSSDHRHCMIPVGREDNCKLILKNKFKHLNEVMKKHGNPTLLSEIYTDLYITVGEITKLNNEHEVRQIEAAFRRASVEEIPIRCNNIFKSFSEQDKPIRTVLTNGVAGIGKTVSVQKFILDWAEGKANQDIHLIFPFPFRELNLMKDKKLSLMDLLHKCFKEIQKNDISGSVKVLFIFDGLDECRFPLDFQNSVSLSDVTRASSVDVVLVNLIKGNLLPSALIWITSRPAAADQIPCDCVDRVTEVRGFSDPQKEEYFRKRISDQSLANRVITHLKSSRSLYIMCHIPVFCWIAATVLERMLGEAEGGEIPKTLTQMYTHFLIIQINVIREKYTEREARNEEIVLKLGQLAFQQLMKGNLIFYEEDLRECGIDAGEAAVYSGVCTQIFREESGVYQSKVYCFVHLTIQEHLAAVYVHLAFMNKKKNVLKQSQFSKIRSLVRKEIPLSDLHKSAVDQALQSKNGQLDLFLRFLLGLSLKSNQNLLQGLLTQTESSSCSKEETVQYIKKMIRENPSAEKSINLFHCLNELDDHSLVEEIQHYLQTGNLQEHKLSPTQWAALVFVLLTSAQEQDVFDLRKYIRPNHSKPESRSGEVLLKLLPVISASNTVHMDNCSLTQESCAVLASVLSSESSSLKELNLNENKLGHSGVKLLSAGLKNAHCHLEILRMQHCNITDEGCVDLALALRSNPSHLRELDLSRNKLGDSGVNQLSFVLKEPHCKLEILRLPSCNITKKVCADFASTLRSNPSHLRELDLSDNKLEDSGVKLLSATVGSPLCKLEILRLWNCCITYKGCVDLASALRSNPSHLRELHLSENKLEDSAMKQLSAVVENPHCRMEILRLRCCNITDKGCVDLASALRSNPSHLKVLHLSVNNLGDSGVKLLSAVVENPHCKLEILRLQHCNITDKGCGDLASALKSNPSHLRELDLTVNNLGDSGVKLLSAVVENPQSKLEILRLRCCDVSNDGCVALASALRSNPSHLRELDLSENYLQDLEVKLLSAFKDDKDYRLSKLLY